MTFKKYNPFTNISLYWNLELLFQDITEIKKSSLTLFEETCVCGLLSGYPPTKIASEIGYTPNSLKVEISRRIYPYISELTGEDKVSWGSVPMLLEDYKHPELKFLSQNLFNLPFSRQIKTTNQLNITHIINIINEAQKTKKILNDSDKLLVNNLVKEGQSIVVKDPYSAIKLFLKAIKIHPFQLSAIVNIIHCYDQLELYYNCFATCDLVLWMLDCDTEITMKDLSASEKYQDQKEYYAKIYTYLGKAVYELAKESKNCLHTKIAYDFFSDSLYHVPYDVIASSNIVDLHITATKNDLLSLEEIQNHHNLAEKAMETLLAVARNPKSNFEKYKAKVIEDAILYCTGLDFQWQQQLENLKSLN